MSKKQTDIFTRFTSKVSLIMGKPTVFISALVFLSAWAISGPILGFSDTWQLIINTSTTIITFLTVFIIQNTQNRDNMAMNIKMDAMMEKLGITDEELIDAEEKNEKALQKKKKELQPNSSPKRSSKPQKRKKK